MASSIKLLTVCSKLSWVCNDSPFSSEGGIGLGFRDFLMMVGKGPEEDEC